MPRNGLVPSLKETGKNRRDQAETSNTPNEWIGLCLRAVHQKFTVVHSPNT